MTNILGIIAVIVAVVNLIPVIAMVVDIITFVVSLVQLVVLSEPSRTMPGDSNFYPSGFTTSLSSIWVTKKKESNIGT